MPITIRNLAVHVVLAWAMWFALPALARQRPAPPVPAVSQGKDGTLGYVSDDRGNRVPDFSHAGYRGGNEGIPTVQAQRVAAPPGGGDDTAVLQAALDEVAQLPVAKGGIRGALLLRPGEYRISGQLILRSSGVVLRGSGMGDGGTKLVATGQDRRPLLRILGRTDRSVGTSSAITDDYVPVNATRVRVGTPHEFKPGDTVVIRRPSTKEWIESIGMHDLGGDRHGPSWRPGSRDIEWDRTIVAVEGESITLDAPITCALDSKFGGGTIAKYTWPGRVREVGIENLQIVSEFDKTNLKDEDHAWFGITIENAVDAWVRQVTAQHFAGSAVAVWESCRRVTVEDCRSFAPVSEIGGWRRNAFVTSGQQVLMQRLYSEDAVHDFTVGFAAAGPNAFVMCESVRSSGSSGAIDSWACGTLLDQVRVDGNRLGFRNRGYEQQGAGWCGANGVLWNASASVIDCPQPPGAQNWAFGTWGEFDGNGAWSGSNDSVNPDSLYYAQLRDRIGAGAEDRAQLLLITTDASSSPALETAAKLIERSKSRAPSLSDWIADAAKRQPIPVDVVGLAAASPAAVNEARPASARELKLVDGRLLIGGDAVGGSRFEVPWWSGSTRALDPTKVKPALTRFVPGRFGPGLTDNLEQVVEQMARGGSIAVEQHPPLWYERRRDDHERIRRMDADVVGPFYEWPFARSGQGVAWDGLSKWDLTKPNPWYWSRLQQFSDLAAERGVVLIHQHYMQHSILEAGAHYADFPWRTANNINDTGFPEPPYYAGDKRVFMAEQFYDVSNPARRELHRKYIRMCLDSLVGKTNVIHLTSEEFTGPLHFAQFWIDTVGEWERDTGKSVLIGLSATREVQDAILADAERLKVVDIIDIRYWWYQEDGSVYAPEGGRNLAPRQWARLLKPKPSSAAQVERAVREYREKYPGKAVIYSADGAEKFGAAVRSAGGSLAR